MPLHPPPVPDDARDWPAFTERLRQLHSWAGSPKYDALSKASGLANSAISNLIGKNPLRRPTWSSAQRLVEACLTVGGVAADELPQHTERWQRVWSAIEEGGDPELGPPPGAASARPTGSGPRLGRLLAAGAAAAVVAAILLVITRQEPALPGVGPSTPTDAPLTARCEPNEDAAVRDSRSGIAWKEAFVCTNVPTKVYAGPSLDTVAVGILRSNPSWFICWTIGGEGKDGQRVWYYTKETTTSPTPTGARGGSSRRRT